MRFAQAPTLAAQPCCMHTATAQHRQQQNDPHTLCVHPTRQLPAGDRHLHTVPPDNLLLLDGWMVTTIDPGRSDRAQEESILKHTHPAKTPDNDSSSAAASS